MVGTWNLYSMNIVSNSKDNSAFGEAPSRRGCRVSKFAMDSFLAST